MKSWLKENKKFSIKTVVVIGLMVLYFTFVALKNSVETSEWFSRNVSRWLITATGFINKYLPFSVMELSFAIAIIFGIVWFVLFIINICKKKFIKGLSHLMSVCLLIAGGITWYQLTGEFQYNRKTLPLPSYSEKVEKTEFYGIIDHFIEDYNYCASQLEFNENGSLKMPYGLSQLNIKLEEEFKRLDSDEFGGYFGKFTPYAKPLATSWFFAQNHITGISNNIFGEPNYNTLNPANAIPTTIAHEIAHSKGVMREDDANYTSFYICLTSKDPYIRYSGYNQSFHRLFALASLTGVDTDYAELLNKIDKNILKNDSYEYQFWQENNLMAKIGEWLNNLYLKSSGTEGTSSYNDTPVVTDPETEKVISFSRWQKLYFYIFYTKISN